MLAHFVCFLHSIISNINKLHVFLAETKAKDLCISQTILKGTILCDLV